MAAEAHKSRREGSGRAMPHCAAHRPLPERCSRGSRYAAARTFAAAITAATFAGGVIMSPVLGQRELLAI